MSSKERSFPLPLSSVVHQGKNRQQVGTAMPQTAVQNAVKNKAQKLAASSIKAVKTPIASAQKHGSSLVNTATATGNSNKRQSPSNSSPSNASPSQVMVSDKIRLAMVHRIAEQGVKDKTVLAAMEAIPRHLFIETGLSSQAYIDASLPIGHHQTISQPYIVARMIEIMRNGKQLTRVLEIGTGCGYQAAVLSLIAKEVYSIERIKALHELAKQNLRPLRIANIRLHYGDGMLGLEQVAPFDGIILAAAGLEVPQSLIAQLAVGGRLIAPVGGRNQMLQLIERVDQNEWQSSMLEHCHFVPLHQGVM